MNLKEAYSKGLRYKFGGLVIGTSACVIMLMGLGKQLYVESANLPFFSTPIRSTIAWVYRKTAFLDFLWEAAPGISHPDIFVESNWAFLSLAAIFVLAMTIRDSGKKLLSRISKARQRAEEREWVNSMGGYTGHQNPPQNVVLQGQEKWHTRPVGIVALAIIGGYIVNLLSKMTGLM